MINNRRLILPYAAPFLAYVFIASFLGNLPKEINYLLRIFVTAGLLIWAWKWYFSIRGPRSFPGSIGWGIFYGITGLFLWTALLIPFLPEDAAEPWSTSAFILRSLSAGLLVPVFEEILMRGYIFRLALQWDENRKNKIEEPLATALDEQSINDVQPGAWSWSAIIISSLVFASGHLIYEWVAAIAYGFLLSHLWIIRKDMLSCIVAHGTTNILLALYVFTTGNWQYW